MLQERAARGKGVPGPHQRAPVLAPPAPGPGGRGGGLALADSLLPPHSRPASRHQASSGGGQEGPHRQLDESPQAARQLVRVGVKLA